MLHVEVVQGLLNVKVVETAYRSRMRAVVDKSTTQAQWNLQTQGQSSSAGDRAFLKVWSHAVERIPTLWNEFPQEVRTTINLTTFHSTCKACFNLSSLI